MNDSWDDYAAQWDTNPDVIKYANLAFDSLCKYQDIKDLAILDFGCGTGALTEKLAGRASSVLAIDSSEKMIQVLDTKNLAKVTTLVCELSKESINRHPLLQSKFDLIVASSVCAFVADFDRILLDLKSLLKKGGTLVQWDWQRLNPDDNIGLCADEIERAYAKAGFNIERIRAEFTLTTNKASMKVLMGIAKKTE